MSLCPSDGVDYVRSLGEADLGPMEARQVLLADGRAVRADIQIIGGAALAGSPTAYCEVDGRRVWVKPGESVEFVEVPTDTEACEFARAVEAWDA